MECRGSISPRVGEMPGRAEGGCNRSAEIGGTPSVDFAD